MATQALVPVRHADDAREVLTIGDIERISTNYAKGGLFGLRDPAAVFTLCMLADAEGKHLGTVLRDYDVIKGKPSKKAEAMQRDFMRTGGRIVWLRLEDDVCEATFTHPIGGEITLAWTKARAVKAKLADKDNWVMFGRAMLRARVLTEGIRTLYPDASSGMYAPEEMDLGHQEGPSPKRIARAGDLEDERTTEEVEDAVVEEVKETPKDKAKRERRQRAELWLAAFQSELGKATTHHEVALVHNDLAVRSMAKLEKDHPDLHAEALTALNEAIDRALGEVSDVPEDLDDLEEVAHDPETGEILDDDPVTEEMTLARAMGIIDACEIVADVKTRADDLGDMLGAKEEEELHAYATQRIEDLKAGRR